MNKKEFIERLKEFKVPFGDESEYVKIDTAIKLASELDKPQKVEIPIFVAEYIEFKKKYDFHVYGAMREIEDHYDKRIPEWFYENNIETFVRAWLDGYEVEKEKRYLVKMKALDIEYSTLTYCPLLGRWTFLEYKTDPNYYRKVHTRKELEDAGFGWVFDCPGMEVEEVEE